MFCSHNVIKALIPVIYTGWYYIVVIKQPNMIDMGYFKTSVPNFETLVKTWHLIIMWSSGSNKAVMSCLCF